MSHLIAKHLLGRLLFLGWLLILGSPLALVSWLLKDREDIQPALVWVFGPLAIACLVGSWWLGTTTAHYMVDEDRMFLDSVNRALNDLRLRLAFIPIVGAWFTPNEEMSSYRDDDA